MFYKIACENIFGKMVFTLGLNVLESRDKAYSHLPNKRPEGSSLSGMARIVPEETEVDGEIGKHLIIECRQRTESVPKANFMWGISDGKVDHAPRQLETDERIQITEEGELSCSQRCVLMCLGCITCGLDSKHITAHLCKYAMNTHSYQRNKPYL